MKVNKNLILMIIISLGFASQTMTKINRLTGRAIAETVTTLKKQMAQGPSQNTAEAYAQWKINIEKLLASLIISKPNAMKLYGFDTLWEDAQKKYSLENIPLTESSAEQIKKNFEETLQEIEESQKADPSALELGDIVEEIKEDIEEAKRYIGIAKLFEESEKEAEAVVEKEQQEEEEEEVPLIAKQEQESKSIIEKIKSVLTKPFTKSPEQAELENKLSQIDHFVTYLNNAYKANVPLKAEPILLIGEYSTALKTFENSLLGQVKNANFGSEKANETAYNTAIAKIHDAYWQLALVQMNYASALTDVLQKNVKTLATGKNPLESLIKVITTGDIKLMPDSIKALTYNVKALGEIVDKLEKWLGLADTEKKYAYINAARSILNASGKLNNDATLPLNLRNDYNVNKFQDNLQNLADNIEEYYVKALIKGKPFTEGQLDKVTEIKGKLAKLYADIEKSLPEKYARKIKITVGK